MGIVVIKMGIIGLEIYATVIYVMVLSLMVIGALSFQPFVVCLARC